jgi:hypothetical protein
MHTDHDPGASGGDGHDPFGPKGAPSDDAMRSGYETSDAPTSPAVIGLVVLVALMLVGFIGGKVFEQIFEATEVRSREAPEPLSIREEVEGPKLQAHPEVELEAYLARERRKLSTYGWVDRSRGVVRIPIERAMELIVRDGLPKWEPVEAKLPEPPASEIDGSEATDPDHGAGAVSNGAGPRRE